MKIEESKLLAKAILRELKPGDVFYEPYNRDICIRTDEYGNDNDILVVRLKDGVICRMHVKTKVSPIPDAKVTI